MSQINPINGEPYFMQNKKKQHKWTFLTMVHCNIAYCQLMGYLNIPPAQEGRSVLFTTDGTEGDHILNRIFIQNHGLDDSDQQD